MQGKLLREKCIFNSISVESLKLYALYAMDIVHNFILLEMLRWNSITKLKEANIKKH